LLILEVVKVWGLKIGFEPIALEVPNVRRGRYLTAILAARLLIVFLAVGGMLSGHTISHRVPGQSCEAAKHKLDGSQDPVFAETRRLSQ